MGCSSLLEVPGAFLFFSLSIHPFGIGAILVGTGLAVHAGKHEQDDRTNAGDQVQKQEPGAHVDVVQPPCPEGEEREQNSQPINRLDHTENGKEPGEDAQDQRNDEVDEDGHPEIPAAGTAGKVYIVAEHIHVGLKEFHSGNSLSSFVQDYRICCSAKKSLCAKAV